MEGIIGEDAAGEWKELQATARRLYANFTATARWEKLMTAVDAFETSKSSSDLEELSKACKECRGMQAAGGDKDRLVSLVTTCLQMEPFTDAMGCVCKSIVEEMISEDTFLQAAVDLLRKEMDLEATIAGGAPGPADDAFTAFTEARTTFETFLKTTAEPKHADLIPANALERFSTLEATAKAKIAENAKEKLESSKRDARAAVAKLEERLATLNWKKRLPESQPGEWSHIVREISYIFWGPSEVKPIEELESLFVTSEATVKAYTDEFGQNDSEFLEEWSKIKARTYILNSEEFCVRHIEENPGKAKKKLNARILKCVDLFDWNDIHQTIQDNVSAITGM